MSHAPEPTVAPANHRLESDSMGKIAVPNDRYYGAQTARSLIHFDIGHDRIPLEVIHTFATLKKACALVNQTSANSSPKSPNSSSRPPTKSPRASSTTISRCASGRPAAARRAT